VPTQALEVLLVLLLTVLFLGLLVEQARFSNHPALPKATRRGPRPLRPRPPDDCHAKRVVTLPTHLCWLPLTSARSFGQHWPVWQPDGNYGAARRVRSYLSLAAANPQQQGPAFVVISVQSTDAPQARSMARYP
jgi:hypothetical protein